MKKYVQKIVQDIHSATTYNFGIAQTKLYRQLKLQTTNALAEFDISPNEWATLGFLYDNPKGIRPTRVADVIGVETAFVTVLIRTLVKKGYISLIPDEEDKRAKKICISKSGTALVKRVEPHLRAAMRPFVKDISIKELITYYKVMRSISKNIENAG